MTPAELRQHLVDSRLAGEVQTSPGNTLRNCAALVSGDERYTFGLSDWRDATLPEAVAAVRRWCGANLPRIDHRLDGAGDGDRQRPPQRHGADVPGAAKAVKDLVRPGDVVLLKASRATGLDAVVAALRANA